MKKIGQHLMPRTHHGGERDDGHGDDDGRAHEQQQHHGGDQHNDKDDDEEEDPVTIAEGFRHVHAPPTSSAGLLGVHADIVPSTEPGQHVHMYVSEKLFGRDKLVGKIAVPSIGGGGGGGGAQSHPPSFVVTSKRRGTDDGQSWEKVFSIKGHSVTSSSKGDRLVLYGPSPPSSAAAAAAADDDKSPSAQQQQPQQQPQQPFAVITKTISFTATKVYHVYGVSPLAPHQKPSSKERLDDGTAPLYPYGRVDASKSPKHPTMDLSDGHGGFVTGVYTSMDAPRKKKGGGGGLLGGVQSMLLGSSGNVRFLQTKADGGEVVVAATLKRGAFPTDKSGGGGVRGPAWDVKVGPGIDPALVLCYVVIADDLTL